jgi:drug/metabolite transporter (DMT)-like permease
MVHLALVPLTLDFLTWGYALARTTAGRMGSMTYLAPPIAILLGWLLLDETPPLLAIAGGALCLAGVYVARGVSPGAAAWRSRFRARAARRA